MPVHDHERAGEANREARLDGTELARRDAARELLSRPELVAAIALMSIVRFASTAPTPVLPLFIQQMHLELGSEYIELLLQVR